MSHGACRPVADSVLGQSLDSPADIAQQCEFGGRTQPFGTELGKDLEQAAAPVAHGLRGGNHFGA